MITFAPTLAVDALAGAALNAEAAGAVDIGGAAGFGDVLQQLMGTAPGSGAGLDLPLTDEGDGGDEPDVDELVNANVVDAGAQPVIRLSLVPTWALTDAPVTPVAVDSAAGPVAEERSVSASAILNRPAARVDASHDIDDSSAVVNGPSIPFEALVPAGGEAASELPVPAIADAPEPSATATPLPPSAAAYAPAAASAPAAAPVSTSVPVSAATSASASASTLAPVSTSVPVKTAGTPVAADRSVAPPAPVEAAPSADATSVAPAVSAVVPGEVPAASPSSTGVADKHEAARQTPRVTAEAGHRAYAAAAAESPAKDTQQGFAGARHEQRADPEPVSPAPAAQPSVPFHVAADRPALPVGATLAAPAVIAAEAVETMVAAELPAQVVQSIRMQAIDGGGEAIVRLRPDYLGELVVAVKVENGAVVAALQSDTPAVRKWIETNEATLRQALAEHGLQLDRLTVSDEAPAAESGARARQDRHEHEHESRPQPRRPRKPAPDATFEVIV